MAYANLRENRAARCDLAALHAARAHVYGEREFGWKSWFTDKAGIARRLKNQDQRRQFRLGLKAAMEFFTQLRIGDLRTALLEGDASIFQKLPVDTSASVKDFRDFFAQAPIVDVLRLFVPEKAEVVMRILEGIESLTDFNLRLCSHLASHQALEPIHAVICDRLRSGTEFATETRAHPLSVATQAIQHICASSDEDASFNAKTSTPRGKPRRGAASASGAKAGKTRSGRWSAARSGGRLKNCCYAFQNGSCNRSSCLYRHVCDGCESNTHGYRDCPNRKDN